MAMNRDDDIDVRVSLKGRERFSQETHRAARDVDELGDEIDQMGRKAERATGKLGALGVASNTTRVNLGPFSTSLRGATLLVGGMANATGGLVPALLSGAEAVATLTGGAAAAGGVGLLGLIQAGGVASLVLGDLTDALGGNQQAARRLSPEMRMLLSELQGVKEGFKETAEAGMMPGLEHGIEAALRNAPVLNKIIGDTAKTLGGLASDAGDMLGSQEWGRDLATLGKANTHIIDDLGHAGLFLADALKDVAVEAAPLAEWLAGQIRDGAHAADIWADQARASGDMAHFFREARTELSLLGSATGHGTRGLINLFGAQDVDGTRTLRNLDRILARFEIWTRDGHVADDLGDAIVDQMPKIVGALTSSLAHAMPGAGATAAKLFLEGFLDADAWGRLLMGGALAYKLGLFKKLGKRTGGPGGALGGGSSGGPVPVIVMNPGFQMPGGPSTTPMPGEGPSRGPRKPTRAERFAQGAGWAAIPFAPDIVRGILGSGNYDQYSGAQGWAELGHDIRKRISGLSTGPMTRPSEPNLNPAGVISVHDRMELVAPVVSLDSVKVGELRAQVLARRQAHD